jgi:hypothetical protein
MPIPSKKDNEKQADYMSRCMTFLNKEGETPRPQDQKVAICLNTFSQPKKKSKANEIEIDITETEAYQKSYKGKKRSELKDGDFLFPENRSFPIVSPQDVRDAISNFGRMGGNMSYDAFIKKLYQKAKSKGQDFVDAIPEKTRKEHKLS